MFIFRYEHDRSVCAHHLYKEGGESLTGHGTFTGCPNKYGAPNFGLCQSAPYLIMPHERCAVTAQQFADWVGSTYKCHYATVACEGKDYCYNCPPRPDLEPHADWSIIAYWVEDSQENTDWREDNSQIIFNPSFAIHIGAIELWEVEQFIGFSLALVV